MLVLIGAGISIVAGLFGMPCAAAASQKQIARDTARSPIGQARRRRISGNAKGSSNIDFLRRGEPADRLFELIEDLLKGGARAVRIRLLADACQAVHFL